MIVENPLNQNKMLKPEQALRLGHRRRAARRRPTSWSESLRWAARVVAGASTVRRPEVDRGAGWDEALARGAGAGRRARLHGAAPAPYRALELLALARDAPTWTPGFAAEDEALADLVMSDELRAGLYAFDLVQKRARRPAGAPDPSLARPVTKVGIVGAGLMAGQLGAAVRPPAARSRWCSPTSTRSGSTRASATCTARSTSCSAKRRHRRRTRPTG